MKVSQGVMKCIPVYIKGMIRELKNSNPVALSLLKKGWTKEKAIQKLEEMLKEGYEVLPCEHADEKGFCKGIPGSKLEDFVRMKKN